MFGKFNKKTIIFTLILAMVLPIVLTNSTAVFAADKYEAENATRSGGANVNNNHTGYSGTGFVDGMNPVGAAVTFNVNVSTAGTYNVKLRYANAMGSAQTLSLYVNGVDVKQTSLPNLSNWDTWGEATETVTLNAGSNTISYRHDSSDTGIANLDYIDISQAVSKYEAENATRTGGATVNNNHTGYSGTGFVDAMSPVGAAVTFNVNVSTAGTYIVNLRYANAMGAAQTLSLYVNGVDVKQTSLPSLSNWDSWGMVAETVTLNAGNNTLSYKHDSSDSGIVNLDYIDVTSLLPPSGSKYEAESATLLGGAHVNNNHAGYSGTGFVDGLNNAGNGVQFTVNAATAGNYQVYLIYANATGSEKRLSLYVNGKFEKRAYLPAAPNWGTWASIVRSVTLNAGNNTISFKRDPEDSGQVNLDFILVTKESYGISYNSSLLNAIPASSTTPSGTFTTTFNSNITQFDNTKWYPKWDEKDVFRMQMSHSQTGNNYSVRIGDGGQIYSIDTPIGEIMPPQNSEHAWEDDTLLATLNQYDGQDAASSRFAQGFIHQAGAYQHYDYDKSYLDAKSFWSPVMSERLDTANNQYASLVWPQMSTGLSVNRSDMLVYQNTRDLGDGVLELTYLFYNYNDTYQYLDNTDMSAWGGVRTSKLPKTIVSSMDGTWFESTAKFGQPGHYYDSINTGGWIGATQDINNPNGYAIAYVFGKNPTAHGGAGLSRFVTIGDAGRDDYSVMSVNYREKLLSGQAYFFRMYVVLGTLQNVAAKANAIQGQLEFGFINYQQNTSPTIPLYLQQIDNQTVLSENGSGTPNMYVYAQPVEGSKPLYLVRETATGKYKVTSDPYMLNTKFQLSAADDTKQRMATRPYDGKSEVVKLFGFVMPSSKINPSLSYVRLDSVLTDSSYYPKLGLYDTNIMVRTTSN